ncbi:MAG: c-type cytochrome [Cyclobacteriaceae bacterium]|nr:c-type cytochrome [Cyclobacteriaceae bacterium]
MRSNKNIVYYVLITFLLVGLGSCNKNNDPNPDQVAFNAADLVNGGRMYDKFWASETTFTTPSDPSVSLTDISSYGDFYRCKACHAWEQKGTMESYIDRGPTTTRPNVSSFDLRASIASSTIRQLFDAVKHDGGAAVDVARTADGTNTSLGGDNMPDYGKILTDEQIWDLVKFLKNGTFDTSLLYDIQTTGTYPTGSRTFSNVGKDGNAVAGKAFYDTNCASCHGNNGRDDDQGAVLQINLNIGKSMGQFARDKPYELQHKARFGNLGSTPAMLGTGDVSITDIKNMMKALSDPTAYPSL